MKDPYITELEDLLMKALQKQEDYRAESKTLGLLAAAHEKDKNYKAELIRERDVEIKDLRERLQIAESTIDQLEEELGDYKWGGNDK